MNQNHFLSVAEFMACPYGNSSKLAHTPHANDLFDTRHHFIITPETSHLGLFATFVNEGALRPSPRGVHCHLDVRLLEISQGREREIASRRLTLRMTRNEYACPMRMDLPTARGTLNMRCTYRAEIRDEDSEVLASLDLMFFSPAQMGMGPTSWFYVPWAGIREESGRVVRSAGRLTGKSVNVVFGLENHIPAGCAAGMPEMQLLLTDTRGAHQWVMTHPARSGAPSDNRHSEWEAAAEFFLPTCDSGIYYVELKCMTYTLAAFLFSTDGSAIGGRWNKAELMPAVNYTLGWGKARFDKYYERATRLGELLFYRHIA